LLKLLTAIEEN